MTRFETSGGSQVGFSASGTAITALAAGGTAMVGVGLKMMVGPRAPEPGYHLEHRYYDFVTGGLMVGCGVVGLTVAARSAWERFSFHKDVLSSRSEQRKDD
jgi:hypothetical protein